MNFPDFIEEILLNKEYNQLTAGEKSNLSEWIKNESEYDSLRSLLLKMHASGVGEERVSPSAQTKESLQAAFAARHRKPSGISKKQVWIISAAASVVIVLAAVFLLVNKEPVTQPQFTETKKVAPAIQVPQQTNVQDTPIVNPVEPRKEKIIKELTVPEPEPVKTLTASVTLADQPDLAELTVVVF